MRSLAGLQRLARRPVVRAAGGDSAMSWWDILLASGSSTPEAISRDQAMQVPGVVAARRLICETIGSLDLHRWQNGQRLDLVDPLATDPNPAMPRSVHYAWVAEDVWLLGQSTLVVLARDLMGRPTRARRVLPGQVVYTPRADALGTPVGPVFYNGRTIPATDVIIIPGPNEGLLKMGRVEIATALAFERAARRFADVPIPMGELHQTEGDPLTDLEIDALVARWLDARGTSGVAFTNQSLDFRTHGWSARELMLNEARQQCALEIARLSGLEPASIGAQVPGSTLTYQNKAQEREANYLTAIRPVATPIAEVLTAVACLEGEVYRWDSDQYTRPDFATRVATGVQAVGGGLLTEDEWRASEGLGPLPEAPELEPAPAPAPATAGVT